MDGEEDQPLASIQTVASMALQMLPAQPRAGLCVLRTYPCFPSLPARGRRSLTPYLTLEMCDFSVFLFPLI